MKNSTAAIFAICLITALWATKKTNMENHIAIGSYDYYADTRPALEIPVCEYCLEEIKDEQISDKVYSSAHKRDILACDYCIKHMNDE